MSTTRLTAKDPGAPPSLQLSMSTRLTDNKSIQERLHHYGSLCLQDSQQRNPSRSTSIITALYVYKTHSKEIHPGVPPPLRLSMSTRLTAKKSIQEHLHYYGSLCLQDSQQRNPSRSASIITALYVYKTHSKEIHPGVPPSLRLLCLQDSQQRNPSRSASIITALYVYKTHSKEIYPGAPPSLRLSMSTTRLTAKKSIQESLHHYSSLCLQDSQQRNPSRSAAIITALYVYKTHSKEIHPGAPPPLRLSMSTRLTAKKSIQEHLHYYGSLCLQDSQQRNPSRRASIITALYVYKTHSKEIYPGAPPSLRLSMSTRLTAKKSIQENLHHYGSLCLQDSQQRNPSRSASIITAPYVYKTHSKEIHPGAPPPLRLSMSTRLTAKKSIQESHHHYGSLCLQDSQQRNLSRSASIITALYVYKTHSKEIHPGAPPSLRLSMSTRLTAKKSIQEHRHHYGSLCLQDSQQRNPSRSASIITALYVYKTHSKEIHPGVPPSLRLSMSTRLTAKKSIQESLHHYGSLCLQDSQQRNPSRSTSTITALYVYKTHSKEIHPGVPPSLRLSMSTRLTAKKSIQERLHHYGSLCLQDPQQRNPSRSASIIMALYVYKTHSKEIHPGEPPSLRLSMSTRLTAKESIQECRHHYGSLCLQDSLQRNPSRRASTITALYVYKTHSKEIHPELTPFSRAKGFRVLSSKHHCLPSLPQQKSSQKLLESLERCFLMDLHSSQPLFFVFFISVLVTLFNGSLFVFPV